MRPIISKPKIIEKGWGYELWIINNDKYCGKSLFFNENSKCSMHYHLKKEETWFVKYGIFILRYINGENAEVIELELKDNETYTIPIGLPHQLETKTGGEIIEISTEHFEYDSYRIWKGDSQIKDT